MDRAVDISVHGLGPGDVCAYRAGDEDNFTWMATQVPAASKLLAQAKVQAGSGCQALRAWAEAHLASREWAAIGPQEPAG